jgi:hypothetical protein
LSAIRDGLFNIFAATLHIGGRSSIRNLRKRHAVVTGTNLSQKYPITSKEKHPTFKKAIFRNFFLQKSERNKHVVKKFIGESKTSINFAKKCKFYRP